MDSVFFTTKSTMKKTSLYLAAHILLMICTPAHASDAIADAHIAFAIFTSGVLMAALLLAVILWLQTRRLHALDKSPSLLDRLPPVLRLEKLLFQILSVGFVLLTILIASGMFFGEEVWGHALTFNHKVIFTLLAWLVFAVLLVGRFIYGWRGLTAVRATIFGFVLLFLAYVGTHFVLDVILKR